MATHSVDSGHDHFHHSLLLRRPIKSNPIFWV